MIRMSPDPDGQDVAANGTPSPSDYYPAGPVGPCVAGGPVGPDDYLPTLESSEHLVLEYADPVGQHDADLDSAESLEHTVVENILDGRPMEGVTCPELLEYSLRLLDATLDGGLVERISEWEPLMNPAISYTLDSRPMEGTTNLERSALAVSLDSRPTEGAPCQEPLEQLVLSPSLAARPDDEVAVRVLKGKPVKQPVQESTPDGQHMEGTTYLEHPALGVSLDSRLKEGMSHARIFEQSVLGEGPIVRPKTAVTSERHHEQTCFKLSARPTPASGLTDVKTDINTDRSENSAPGNTSEIFEQSVLREGSIVQPETAVMSERHHKQTCFHLSTDVNTDMNTDWSENSAPRNTSERFEQSVLGEGSIVRPKTAVTNRHVVICWRGRRQRLS